MIKRSWWVDFTFNHERFRKKSPENSRAGALAYESVLRTKIARGVAVRDDRNTKNLSFDQFSKQWFTEYVVPNNKPSEQKAKAYVLSSSLVPFFGKVMLEGINAHDIERYKAHEKANGLAAKTINNKLAVLRKCLVVAHEWDYRQSPPPKVKQLKCVPPKMDYLNQEECEGLLRAAEGITREMILIVLRTGMRQGEVRGLQWESVDWHNRQIVVRHSLCDYAGELTSTKSNRERYVPLADDVYLMLHARRRESGYVFARDANEPFNGNNLLKRLHRVQRAAGLRTIGWHTLRHTFASQLAMNGVPMRVVQELLGHSTISMTMRYSHVGSESLRAAVNGLSLGYTVGYFGHHVVNHESQLSENRANTP